MLLFIHIFFAVLKFMEGASDKNDPAKKLPCQNNLMNYVTLLFSPYVCIVCAAEVLNIGAKFAIAECMFRNIVILITTVIVTRYLESKSFGPTLSVINID